MPQMHPPIHDPMSMETQKAQHTPGPWHFGAGRYIFTPGGDTIATMEPDADWEDEQTANARIMAASPDLLSVLKELSSREECMGKENDEDLAWIANHGHEPARSLASIQMAVRAALAKAEGGEG